MTTAPATTVNYTANVKASAIKFNINQQCPIQYVTVYNDRAEITRSVQHHFDVEGTYDLIFEGFSPSVDLTSLHVSGGSGKGCTILEVSYQTSYEDTAIATDLKPLDELQNELDNVRAEISKHERELARLVKQREWLQGRATKLMNQDAQITVDELNSIQQFIEFYHKHLLKLDDETTDEQSQIKKLQQQEESLKAKMTQQGVQAAASRRKEKREVTIAVHIGMNKMDLKLDLSYLISNCSWTASYDVRVNSAEATRQQTQLTYYGIIVNKSQENWPDVQLSLSTATPSLGGTPPKLATLKIDYKTPRYNYDYDHGMPAAAEQLCIKSAARLSKRSMRFMPSREVHSLCSTSIDEFDEESHSNTVNVLAAQAEASMSSTSFAIPRKSTIDADGKPHKVTIGVLDLTSTFTYTVVPKLSTHVYLKASTVNTSDKQLLAGPVSVFMDNNFITHSTIENVCMGDTFSLSLGTDASIKVEYKPVKKVTDTQGLISKVNYETIRHETRVNNTKSNEITIFVYEQVPLSSNEKIKVKLIAPELRSKDQGHNCTVTLNDANNLEWKCILAARGECRLPLEYTLEWPKDKSIEYKQV